jgi:hypothetical protein
LRTHRFPRQLTLPDSPTARGPEIEEGALSRDTPIPIAGIPPVMTSYPASLRNIPPNAIDAKAQARPNPAIRNRHSAIIVIRIRTALFSTLLMGHII